MRGQIWATLNDLKFKGFCLGFLVHRYQNWDRYINIFLALASSSSIAAWVIWKSHPMVWSSVIAASQVITVIKPYFPYFKYVKELNNKCSHVQVLNIEFERLWYNLEHKKINHDQAVEVYFDLKKEMNKILTFSDDTIFKTGKKIEKKANLRMQTFLRNNYNAIIQVPN
jgi:hypothetical protein